MKILIGLFALLLSGVTLGAQGYGCPPPSPPPPPSSFTSSFATPSNFGQAQFANQVYTMAGQARSFAYQEIKGSPYLNDEPTQGVLVLNNGDLIKDILLQMDLYTNEVIATKKNGDVVILDNVYFREVIIPFEGQDVVYKKTNPQDPDNFYEVLYEGPDMVFFKQRDVALREGVDHGISKVDSKFSQRNKYFIKHGEGAVAKVKLKKKEILSGFEDAELLAMKEYARENGLKFKDETDYIAIFEGVYSDEATLED